MMVSKNKGNNKDKFFKMGKFTKIGFRLLSWKPLFEGEYQKRHLFYFRVQERYSGMCFVWGLDQKEVDMLFKEFNTLYISEANYRNYVIWFWMKPFTLAPNEEGKTTAGKVFFKLTIEDIETISKESIKRLDHIRLLLDNGKIKSKYL